MNGAMGAAEPSMSDVAPPPAADALSGPVMKKIVVTIAAIASVVAVPAFAANLPVKAPPPPGPVAYAWTGLYVGGNLGYGVGRNPTDISEYPAPLTNLSSTKLLPAGVIGGGQIGYRWQWAPAWVIGVETDFQGAGQNDRACTLDCLPIELSAINTEQKLKWFGTVRGVLGWAHGSQLWYLTGGYAYGKVTNDSTFVAGPPPTLTGLGAASSTKDGWTAGAGVETRLWNSNWSAKFEYLYMDLGGQSYDVLPINPAPRVPSFHVDSAMRDHIIRVGLNYTFGEPVAGGAAAASSAVPASRPIYKAPPGVTAVPYTWTGFYIGGNAGYGVGRDPADVDAYIRGAIAGDLISTKLSPAGGIGGGQIGYRWQWAPAWVVGVEADFDGADQHDQSCTLRCGFSRPFESVNLAQNLKWFGTARGIVGWAHDDYLWYLTGGYAYGKVASSGTLFINPSFLVASGGASGINSGWTVGAGVETRLWKSNWSARLEYLYVDLGNQSFDLTNVFTGAPMLRVDSAIRDHIVRVGLNYRFGSDTPLVARD